MYSGTRAHYAVRYGRPFPELGRRGLRISVISGIDIALWDILGKKLGAPIFRLLGGRVRERIPAYASGGWFPVSEIGEQLRSIAAAGDFRAVKMRVGVMDGEVRLAESLDPESVVGECESASAVLTRGRGRIPEALKNRGRQS